MRSFAGSVQHKLSLLTIPLILDIALGNFSPSLLTETRSELEAHLTTCVFKNLLHQFVALHGIRHAYHQKGNLAKLQQFLNTVALATENRTCPGCEEINEAVHKFNQSLRCGSRDWFLTDGPGKLDSAAPLLIINFSRVLAAVGAGVPVAVVQYLISNALLERFGHLLQHLESTFEAIHGCTWAMPLLSGQRLAGHSAASDYTAASGRIPASTPAGGPTSTSPGPGEKTYLVNAVPRILHACRFKGVVADLAATHINIPSGVVVAVDFTHIRANQIHRNGAGTVALRCLSDCLQSFSGVCLTGVVLIGSSVAAGPFAWRTWELALANEVPGPANDEADKRLRTIEFHTYANFERWLSNSKPFGSHTLGGFVTSNNEPCQCEFLEPLSRDFTPIKRDCCAGLSSENGFWTDLLKVVAAQIAGQDRARLKKPNVTERENESCLEEEPCIAALDAYENKMHSEEIKIGESAFQFWMRKTATP